MPDAKILAIRPTALSDLSVFDQNIAIETGFRPDFDKLAELGHRTEIAENESFDFILVFLTRHRGLNQANISNALSRLPTGGWLMLDGQKTDGIESLLKQLRKSLEISGVVSKSHGKALWLQRPSDIPQDIRDWSTLTNLAQNSDDFLTAPGMFSHERIDAGTHFLAETFKNKISGPVADLGAGWGAATALLLKAAPDITSIDLFEAEQDALNAAKQNINDPRASFHWSDVSTLPKPENGYKLVISNPPFHVSRAAQPEIGANFISAAARILHPKGKFLMVANRQLPYESVFEAHFKKWTEISANPRYKVISASVPKRPAHRG